MPATCGIIGVGHLIRHMLPALIKSDFRFLLSLRNREISAELSQRHNLEIVTDPQELVNLSNIIILAVRPFHAIDTVKSLVFNGNQTVLSFCAGVDHAALAPAVAPARLVMAMPVIAAEFGESPTILFPDDALCRSLLSYCGPLISLNSDRLFAEASVIACYYGWVHELIDRMVQWTQSRNLEPFAARLLVSQMTRAAATAVRERSETSIDDLVAELATPRSFTLTGLEDLRRDGAFELWQAAATKLAIRLKS